MNHEIASQQEAGLITVFKDFLYAVFYQAVICEHVRNGLTAYNV